MKTFMSFKETLEQDRCKLNWTDKLEAIIQGSNNNRTFIPGCKIRRIKGFVRWREQNVQMYGCASIVWKTMGWHQLD